MGALGYFPEIDKWNPLDGTYQGKDATLDALASLSGSANQMHYFTGPDTLALTALSPFARTILDDSDEQTVRNTLHAHRYSGVVAGDPQFGTWDPTGVVSSQAAIEAAVLAAFNAQVPIFWTFGTYLTTANIPHLHEVMHLGYAFLRRNFNFKIGRQKKSDSSFLYCSPTGLATNDGLHSTQPMTFQAALDAVFNYGPRVAGIFQINLAAGDYPGPFSIRDLSIGQYLKIVGPVVAGGHPNPPTAWLTGPVVDHLQPIFDIAGGSMGKYLIQDLGFKDADNGRTINCSGGCNVSLTNVHSMNTMSGVVCSYNSNLAVSGGLWAGKGKAYTVLGDEGIGLVAIFGGTITLDAIDNAHACKISFFVKGLTTQEGGGNGHTDYTWITDCGTGYYPHRGTGDNNTKSMLFERCDVGIDVANSTWFNNGCSFGTGADACTIAVKTAGNAAEYDFRTQDYSSKTPRQQAINGFQTLLGGGGLTRTVFTAYNTRKAFVQEGGHTDRIRFHGKKNTVTAAQPTLKVKIGSSNGATINLGTGTEVFRGEFVIHHLDFDSHVTTGYVQLDGAAGNVAAAATITLDLVTNDNQPITLELVMGNAADSVTFNYCICDTTIGG